MPKQSLSRIKRLAKEGSWIVAGQIAAIVGSLVLVRVLTEHLDPAQYGQLALGFTIAGLINQVVMGGLTNGIIRFYSIAAEKQDLGRYLHATRRLMLYATQLLLVISLIVITGLWCLGYSQWIALTAALLMFSVLSAYNSMLSGIQNAARQRAIVALHGSLDAWLKIILSLSVMFWLGNSSEAVVIGYACSSLLVIVSQLVLLRRTIPKHDLQNITDQDWMGQIWTYSLPFAKWGIFGWAQQSSARWALEAFTTTETVGLYSVLSQLGYAPIQIATSAMMTFLMPIIFAKTGDAQSLDRNNNVRDLTNKLVLLGFCLIVFAVLVAAVLHSYIFELLVNYSYFSVSYLLPWMVLSGGIFAVSQLVAMRLQALMLTQKFVTIGVIVSIVGFLSSFIGSYIGGLPGAIYAQIIFSVTYLIAITVFVNRSENVV